LATYLRRGRSGEEWDRVAWSSARNLPTDDPELAATFMRATAEQNTRVTVPVYHVAISFDPQDAVTRAQMEQVADAVLQRLGLADHQAVLVAHQDRAHAHVHILVNRVHPETGKAWERWKDRPIIERVLREQEQALGLRAVNGRLAPLPDREVPDRIAADGLTSGERRHRARAGDHEVLFVEQVRALAPTLRTSQSWAAWETALAQHGLRAVPKGQGLVITDGVHAVKASRIGRDLSRHALEQRFGVAYEARATFGLHGPEAHVEALAATVRQYDHRRTTTRRHYDATLQVSARQVRATHGVHAPRETQAALEDVGIARRRLRHLALAQHGLPTMSSLERRIAAGMDQLTSSELRRLKRLLTDPQFALAVQIRQRAREIVLGREEPSGRSL
jgi:hypothetical protein